MPVSGLKGSDKWAHNRQDSPMPTPDLIGRRFAKAQSTYGHHAQVQARVSARLAELNPRMVWTHRGGGH